MRAALIDEVGQPLRVAEVTEPTPSPDGIVLEVEATGVCRSDWHAWIGHEPLPGLPHVPGHEMAGTVAAVGSAVRQWAQGDRVTVPFSIGCGQCTECARGNLNTCQRPFTPGFTHWGSYAERVSIQYADLNLVELPSDLSSVHAAALGCRFITSYRAVVDQGRLAPDEWLAVHGCGGVGLSAVMIAKAVGGHVAAVDISEAALDLASDLGADVVVNAAQVEDVAREVRAATGGADVSIDALGSTVTMTNSLNSLKAHGRHVQVGLMYGENARPPIYMEPIIAREIEIIGSRGMPATDYGRVFDLIASGAVDPARLVTKTISLDEAGDALAAMSSFTGAGVTVIDSF